MAFIDQKYETNQGAIIQVRVDEELDGVTGTEPAGAVTLGIHGIINGNRSREFGVHPRGVRLQRTRGTGEDTFRSYKFIPVLTQADLDGAGFAEGDTITISSIDWTVSDQVEESRN